MMFRSVFNRTFVRFSSSTPNFVSKYINSPAFPRADKKAGEEFVEGLKEKVEHSESVTALWKKLTYFVALPAIILTALPVGQIEWKHAEHRKHCAEIPDDEWPTQYSYQNIRAKKFFWGDGDKTLFWNKDINRHITK